MVEALVSKKLELAESLLWKYNTPGMAAFVGTIIRLFTKSGVSYITIYALNIEISWCFS